jgi:ribosomal protein S1
MDTDALANQEVPAVEIPAVEAPAVEDSADSGEIKRKTHFTGTVVKTMLAGAVVDIGLGIPGVVHISQIQKDPVNKVEDVIKVGQSVDVWVRRVPPKKDHIELTMIKPLALEWKEMDKDMVLKGKVVKLEKFGVFVDVGAERPGLVHISEMTHDYVKSPAEVVKEGDEVEVKILNVNRQKKQIKLSMKALEEPPVKVAKEVQRFERQSGRFDAAPAAPEEKEEPIPTALEFALREAMEKSNAKRTDNRTLRGSKKKNMEIEDILSRTLQNKGRTGK